MDAFTGSSGLGFRIVGGGRGHHSQRLQASPILRVSIPAQARATAFTAPPPRPNLPSVLSDDELAALDEARVPITPPPEAVERIGMSVARRLAQFDRVKACAVCEMAFPDNEVIALPLSDLVLKAMKKHLAPPSSGISHHVLRQYDASTIDPRLSGLLLYPPGISRQHHVTLVLCGACHDSLNKENPSLPRLAIANGNFIGWYDGDPLSWLDEQMIALLSPCVSMTSIAGGRQRCIRSHHYVVRNTAGPPVTMLPENAADCIRVAMVGAMTPDQIAKCKKRYTVNAAQCKRALAFLCNEHEAYKSENIRVSGAARISRAEEVSVLIDRTQGTSDAVDEDIVQDMEDMTSYSNADTTRCSDPAIETQWIEERTVLLNDSSQPSDFFFRKSNAFESTQRWEHAVKMFPVLFPGGRGGPNEPRKQQYSLRTWITRCLRLHGCRFEKHEVFLLLAFDYLALEAARQRMFIRLKASTDAVVAGQVTPAVMKECMDYRRHLEEATSAGVRPTPPSEAISTIMKLQRGVYAGEVGYYGSDKSRAHGRNDIFGYISRLGPLQLFFTVSPDSAGTYSISCRSGSLDAATLQRANAHLLPTRTTRRATATTHPYQCALYFDNVMNVVIDDVLGWHSQHQRPKRGGGLVGVVRAFAASAETQVSGDLHAHFAVWLHGFPTSATANEEALEDPHFREALGKYVDSISTTVIPGVTDNCLNSQCSGRVRPVELPDSAYRKPKRGGRPCTVGVCDQCKAAYTSEDMVNAAIREDLTTAEADFIRCRNPPQTPLSNEELSVILRDVQIHKWTHTKSCFKTTRRNPTGNYCRFQRPVPANVDDTFLNEAQEVVHQRPVGSEYVNPYNKTMTRLFRCNHDLRLVMSSTSKDVAAYICKYVMKPQNRIENETALALATYEKAVNSTNSRIQPTEDNSRARGNSVYASWLYHLTNQQDVAASLAALFIVRESAFWFSHEVSRVYLDQLLASFDGSEDGETTVQVSPDVIQHDVPVFEYVNALKHYWKRPVTMEDICLVEVVEEYDNKQGRYTKRDARRILVLCGKALADIAVCVDNPERERYFKAMLMLYKPSRGPINRQPGESFEAAYADFLNQGPAKSISQAHAHASRLADSYSAKRASAEADDVPLGSSANRYSSTAGLAMDRPEEEEEDGDAASADGDNEIAIPTTDEQFARYDRLLGTEGGLHEVIENSARQQLAGYDQAAQNVSAPFETEEASDEEDEVVHGTTEFLRIFRTQESQLQQLDAYMNPIPWVNPASAPRLPPENLAEFATVGDVSRAFQLNLHQHVAFETTARHVLFAYAQDISVHSNLSLPEPTQTSGLKKQLIGYLGGEAGTGKSQVIHALLHFAKLWKREGSIETIAYTGVAANNVNGKTIHSARNIPVNSAKRPNISEEMRSKFGKVVLTICDEISMVPQALLGRANAATHELVSPDLDLPWGGRHILFCGDWMQIPPVKGRPCYSEAGHRHSRADRNGYELYRAINFVVFLTENMRSRYDAEYTAILSRLRWGQTTPQDIAALNTRVGQAPTPSPQNPWYFHPIIVPTNQLRCAINYRMTYETAACHGAQVFECNAQPTTSRSAPTLKKVQHLDDSCTERIPLKLLYFFGMPVMLSQRSKPSEEATANGTLAFVAGHDLQLETDADFLEERNGCTVHVLHNMPRRLILRLPGQRTRFDKNLPRGYLYIEPVHKSIEVDIPRRSGESTGSRKRSRSLHLTVRQFAIAPAFACTPEKLQGLTCHDGATLLKLERPHIPPQTLYVALSRTTALNKLVLTNPIDIQFLRTFKPQKAAVAEIKRLLSQIQIPPYVTSEQCNELELWIQTQTTI